MQLKMFGDDRRVDVVNSGVWAMRFFSDEEYRELQVVQWWLTVEKVVIVVEVRFAGGDSGV
ncbi:putative vacuolar import/degradation Vid27 [Helianthus annuus]|nr:putative vacuolar import/degradation Vid27 [Helianthus annuus]